MLDSNVDSYGWLMFATFGVNHILTSHREKQALFDTFQEKVLWKIFMKV